METSQVGQQGGWEFGEGEAENRRWNEIVRAYPVYLSG